MVSLNTPIAQLPRMNKKTAAGLKKLNVTTVRDLLFYFPYRYLDFSKFKNLSDVKPGEIVTLRVVIKSITGRYSFRGRMSLCEAVVSDSTDSLKVVWFNQPWVAKTLKQGDEVFLSGKPEIYKNLLQLSNPIYELASDDSTHTGRLVPVYSLTEGLYNKTLQRLVKSHLSVTAELTDEIPDFILKNYELPSLKQAVLELHFPTSETNLQKAKSRVVFDEIFFQQLAVLEHKKQLKELPAPSIKPNVALIKTLLTKLPFMLTEGQKRSLWQIMQDMETKHPMNRLLQGDVGSGKTVVALLSAQEALEAGFQIAFLAPTEILAKQHYENYLNSSFANSEATALLTNHFQMIGQRHSTTETVLNNLGTINLIFGTHSLLNEKVQFNNLGLVIIDEQHRFGVRQRALLLKQGENKKVPHLLSMSATPIPRTLALTLYGDLEISNLTELPSGRKKIITEIVPPQDRERAYALVRKELEAGQQGFIITPLVEESEALEVKSAKQEHKRLQKEVFPDYKLGLLYGGMKGVEKDKTMQGFNAGKIQLLVATSVVEIGIDVKNASVILIEDAERFGLAQLHQLRGRVGRGEKQSYCFLLTETQNEESLKRLRILSGESDGFKLAEFDLQQRGMGSLFGNKQTGFDFKFSQFLSLKILALAKTAAEEALIKDPKMTLKPLIKAKIQPFLENIHLE